MNNKIWKNSIVGIVAAFAVAISVDHGVAQKKSDAQKEVAKAQEEADKAQEEADKAKEEADKAQDGAYKAPSGQADLDAEKADQQAEKDEQAAREAQDKADQSQARKESYPDLPNSAADDQKAADAARDKAQESENNANAAAEKADKNEGDKRQKINRQKQKEKRKKLQEAWEKQRKLKRLQGANRPWRPTTAPFGTSLAMLASTGQIKIDTIGTGETIGHIADLMIQNLTDQPLNVSIQPMILESGSGKNQHYACPKGKTVALKPHGSATVPMDGVCVNRSKPPVGKGVSGDLLVNEGNPNIAQDPKSHLKAKDADKLLRIATSKYDAADKLQKDGALKDLPYHDKQKQKDIVVQWSTWTDPQISEITGAPPATKEDLKKVVYKQVEQNGPMTPETKKKVDQGIDTIFEKIELTTTKAKDLEKPDTFAAENNGESFATGGVNVSNDTPTPAPQTQEKPKKKKKKKKWPKPIQDWVDKKRAADEAEHKRADARTGYDEALHHFFRTSKHWTELDLKKIHTEAKASAPGATQQDKDDDDNVRKERTKLEGELEKDFQKTPEGQKEFEKVTDADKAADKANDAEKEAGKNIDPATKEAVQKAENEAKEWGN